MSPPSFLLSVSLTLFPIAQAPVAPTPVPAPIPTPIVNPTSEPIDREVLKDQLQFLKDANTGLNTSFANYVNAINVSFVVLAAIVTVIGILGGVAAYTLGQNLKEIRESVKQLVEQEVERLVAVQIRDHIENLKRVVDREKILSTVSVDYVLPQSDSGEPEEYRLLGSRGFKQVTIYHQASRFKLTAGVVVLDLITVPIREETEIAQHLQATAERLSNQAILVIYFRGRSGAIDEYGNRVRYYAVANTPVNLMGVVVDAASVAHAWQRSAE